jgi:hypothetical protein
MTRPKDVIAEEYLRNREAYKEMVGTLYPSIVYAQLIRLRLEYMAAGGDPNELPWVPPPCADGRAPVITK